MERPSSRIRWFPEFNRHLIPPTARKFIIFSHVPTVLNFCLKRSANIQIIVNPGLTIVCLCNLFSSTQNIKRYTYDRSFIFCKYKILDLTLHESYHDKSILVVSIINPNTEETLKSKAILSLLRLGNLYISRRRLRAFPLPFRNLYWKTNIYNGYVKRLVITHKPDSKIKHLPDESRPWGKVFTKWVRIRNCINRCGVDPNNKEPIPLSAIPILYEGSANDMLAELRANFVEHVTFRYPFQIPPPLLPSST